MSCDQVTIKGIAKTGGRSYSNAIEENHINILLTTLTYISKSLCR